jgi:hypothetical protein
VDDAFVRNMSVCGPLNIARPSECRRVIVQADAPEAGRQLAAETAEVKGTFRTLGVMPER